MSTATTIAAVTAIVNDLSKALEEARKHLNQGADKGLEMRGKAREMATLLHKNAPTDDVMNDIFKVQLAGGGTFADAVEYDEGFEGALPAGKDAKHVTDAQAEQIKVLGKTFADRVRLDPTTSGELMGSIPQFVDLTRDEKANPLTTEQGVNKFMGTANAIHYGLNEGRGKVSTLARNELGASAGALADGRVADHAELSAFVGLGSNISKGAAGSGTTYNRLSRLLHEGMGDGGEFLKQIGVADQKGDLAKLRKLKEYVDAQRKASADPSKFNTSKFLQSKGFGNDEEVRSASGYMASMPVLETRITNAREKLKDGPGALQANREFMASEEGQHRQGVATGEIGEYMQTKRRQRLQAARRGAEGQLRSDNKIDTAGTIFVDKLWDRTVGTAFQEDYSRQQRNDQQVEANIMAGLKKAGISYDSGVPGMPDLRMAPEALGQQVRPRAGEAGHLARRR